MAAPEAGPIPGFDQPIIETQAGDPADALADERLFAKSDVAKITTALGAVAAELIGRGSDKPTLPPEPRPHGPPNPPPPGERPL